MGACKRKRFRRRSLHCVVGDTDRDAPQQRAIDPHGRNSVIGGAFEEAVAGAGVVRCLERDALAHWVVELLIRDRAGADAFREATVGEHAVVDIWIHENSVA